MGKIKPTIKTYNFGNSKILVSELEGIIKNAYVTITFKLGTDAHYLMHELSKSKEEDAEKNLIAFGHICLACMQQATNPEFQIELATVLKKILQVKSK